MTKKNRQRVIRVFAVLAIVGLVVGSFGGGLAYLF